MVPDKAPGSQIHHQHGNKPNLAQYVRGQCWVSLAWVIRREKQPVPKRIAHLKRSMVTLPLYGKEQEVRYRSKVLMAHFLGGRLVALRRFIWISVWNPPGWQSCRS